MIPLTLKTKLAPNPTNPPKYSVTVKDDLNNDVILGDPRATRALVILMNQHATIGGAAAHWGGPAAFSEMVSAVHGLMFKDSALKKTNWFNEYNFVNDAGHAENGIYALRANYGFDNLNFSELKKFRSIESKLTGHGEAHLNPEGVFISNGPLGSGLPQAQGLAMADKIIGKERTTICLLSDGAAMEGEAKESFAAIPGLASKNKINPFVLIISDNNTKLGGRIDEDSFSMAPTFNSLETLGWKLLRLEEGHNLQKVYTAIENAVSTAKAEKKPVALVIKTIKGRGVKSTEESASGGHGHPLSSYSDLLISFIQEIYCGEAPSEFIDWAQEIIHSKPAPKTPTNTESTQTEKMEKVQDGFARGIIRAAKEGLPVFSLSSDLQSSTGIKAFHKEFPDRYIDLGIAESNMISAAIGLSKQGLIPIVDTFAQFGITKGNLPFIMAGLSEGPIIALFSHTGFQDAADGASHQATTYFAALSSIPHVTVVNCACSSEAEAFMYEAISHFAKEREKGNTPNSVVFFLGREAHPVSYTKETHYEWKKANVLTSGTDVTIIAAGPMVAKALEANQLMQKNGLSATVINHSFINHVDLETLKASLKKTNGKLITIEDHQVLGGMGSIIIHALHTSDTVFTSRTLGIQGEFGQSAYNANQLYKRFDLNAEGIMKAYLGMCTK
jgi:transketolase